MKEPLGQPPGEGATWHGLVDDGVEVHSLILGRGKGMGKQRRRLVESKSCCLAPRSHRPTRGTHSVVSSAVGPFSDCPADAQTRARASTLCRVGGQRIPWSADDGDVRKRARHSVQSGWWGSPVVLAGNSEG